MGQSAPAGGGADGCRPQVARNCCRAGCVPCWSPRLGSATPAPFHSSRLLPSLCQEAAESGAQCPGQPAVRSAHPAAHSRRRKSRSGGGGSSTAWCGRHGSSRSSGGVAADCSSGRASSRGSAAGRPPWQGAAGVQVGPRAHPAGPAVPCCLIQFSRRQWQLPAAEHPPTP